MMSHGVFCWNELMTPNVEKAKAFYAKALGWHYEGQPMPDGGTYWTAFLPGRKRPVAGLMQWSGDEVEMNDWFAYVAIDSMPTALAKARAAGGWVIRGPWTVDGVGRIAIVADSVGAAIGYLEPSAKDRSRDAS